MLLYTHRKSCQPSNELRVLMNTLVSNLYMVYRMKSHVIFCKSFKQKMSRHIVGVLVWLISVSPWSASNIAVIHFQDGCLLSLAQGN